MPPLFFKSWKVSARSSSNNSAWGVAASLKFSFPFSSNAGRERFNEEQQTRETKSSSVDTQVRCWQFPRRPLLMNAKVICLKQEPLLCPQHPCEDIKPQDWLCSGLQSVGKSTETLQHLFQVRWWQSAGAKSLLESGVRPTQVQVPAKALAGTVTLVKSFSHSFSLAKN